MMIINKLKFLIIPLFFLSFTFAFAENNIFITQSYSMGQIIFDGKWTFKEEWKNSSEDKIPLKNGHSLNLKTAHQENNLYFLIEFVTDTNEDSFKDKAMICFDTKNNKNIEFDSNDYCFVIVHQEQSYILSKNSTSEKNVFQKEVNDKFTGNSTMTDKKNRYSSTPHMSYEFKIPTDIIGRSSNYGFYLSVHEGNSEKTYSWPNDFLNNSTDISSPSEWGQLISPDKTLPEFSFSMIFYVSISTIIGLLLVVNTRFNRKINF